MEKELDDKILENIAKTYNLSKGDLIDYKIFTDIYVQYKKDYTELEFASLLGINDRSFNRKLIKNQKVFVFMNQELTKEHQDQLLEELIKKYHLFKKQEITKSFFDEMFDSVRIKMTEIEFANLLGVKKDAYNNFKLKSKKNEKVKLVILANRELKAVEKRKRIQELIEKYNLHKGQEIDYPFFLEMYETVKTYLTQIEFASLLGINESSLKNIKSPKHTQKKARLFGNIELNEEVVEKIRKSILNKYEGKSIYIIKNKTNKGDVNFLQLYKPYRIYFTQNEFARVNRN